MALTNHPGRNRAKKYPRRAAVPENEPTMATPSELRAARRAVGHTQREAAAAIYVTHKRWEDWEGAQRSCHPAFLELYLIKTRQERPKYVALGELHPIVELAPKIVDISQSS